MAILLRLNWTTADYVKYNNNRGDFDALANGWSAFIENVLTWDDVQDLFVKKADKGASQQQCFFDILAALRADNDYFNGRSGNEVHRSCLEHV